MQITYTQTDRQTNGQTDKQKKKRNKCILNSSLGPHYNDTKQDNKTVDGMRLRHVLMPKIKTKTQQKQQPRYILKVRQTGQRNKHSLSHKETKILRNKKNIFLFFFFGF